MTPGARKLAVVVCAAALTLGLVGCDDDDVQDAIDEFLATNTPEAAQTPGSSETAEPGEPTEQATPDATGSELTTTEGWCEHGEGESTLYIILRGARERSVINGMIVSSPEGGLFGLPSFAGSADDEGRVIVAIPIQRFGTYAWEASAGTDGEWTGEFTVAEVCPPEPAE